jgi:N-acetylmuramoyl-L-alanine amidase
MLPERASARTPNAFGTRTLAVGIVSRSTREEIAMAAVVVDPGHGGLQKVGGSSPNNATSPSGQLEKDLTLAVARHVEASLTARGHVVTLTRTTDTNLGLSDRAAQ